MQLTPYLNFDGQCDEAFKFYEKVLGGKISFRMTWGEMPGKEQFPPETYNRIMHISMTIGDQSLMGADSPPGGYQRAQGIHLSLHFKEPAEGERVFNALADNGTVQMPFQKTFW